MDSHESISLSLTSKEYSTLSKISGWSDRAEMIIMTPKILDNGAYVINGTKKDFEELASTISEELDFDMCKKKDRAHLVEVLEKLDSCYRDIYGY